MRHFLLLLLLLPATLAAQTVYELPVDRVEFCTNSRECRTWRPYVRLGDMDGPIWFLVSISGMACEVDGMIASKIRRRSEPWLCAWRTARP